MDAAGDVAAGVEEHGRQVATVAHRAPDEGSVFTEAHERDLETGGPEARRTAG